MKIAKIFSLCFFNAVLFIKGYLHSSQIHSDREDAGIVVTYTISGQGVTEPPYGLFVIDGKTGNLNITGKVDREKTPMLFVS